jgi:hypothetical protein
MDTYTMIEQSGRYQIEPGRLQRARDQILAVGGVSVIRATQDEIRARVRGRFEVVITLRPALNLACECDDWLKQGQAWHRPCKHLLATALEVPTVAPVSAPNRPPVGVPPVANTPHAPFGHTLQAAVATAVSRLSETVEALVGQGEIPFLIGPTGSGKTSAVREVATRNDWGFEEVGGAPSFADADLVGIRMQGGTTIPGVFARAFERARAGETVLLFLDEFLRLNQRAQDILMRPFLPTPARVARAMGIATTEDVRLIEAPLWGVEWAPVERIKLVLAANPWGALIDPALVRRVTPVLVGFDQAVAGHFDSPLREAIQASWQMVQGAELPLPLEYSALCRATGARDQRLLEGYLMRLRAVDVAAAEGFKTVLEGIGLKLP